MRDGPKSAARATASGTFVEAIESLLSGFRPQQSIALRALLGVDGGRRSRVEAAQLSGLSSVNVQRLYAQFYARFLASPAADALVKRIARLRAEAHGPLFVRDLPSKDQWFAGLASDSEVLQPLLQIAPGSDLRVSKIPGGKVLTPRSMLPWEELLGAASRAVAALGRGTSRRDVRNTAAAVLEEYDVPELLEPVLRAVESRIQYSSSDVVLGFGKNMPLAVEAILEDAAGPLHYSEIARRYAERIGEPVSLLAVHKALGESRNVYLLGHGTFGVDRHIGVGPRERKRIVTLCESIVTRNGPRKQWHTSELLEALKPIGRFATNLDKYRLEACLSRSSVLESLGRFVWIVRRPGKRVDRIDLRDAAVQALERAGHPLRDGELRLAISRSRGVNALVPLPRTERIVLVAPMTWGLLDRDFRLTKRQRQAVGNAVYEAVTKKDGALRTSELSDAVASLTLPDDVTPYMIGQIAALDPRLRLLRGGRIGLRVRNT